MTYVLLAACVQATPTPGGSVPPLHEQLLVGVSGNAIFWTGMGFAAFLVLVFAFVLIVGLRKISQVQYEALRVLSSILAGAASGFISGGAMVQGQIGSPGNQLTVLGTAGFAMAILVWWKFPKYQPVVAPHAPDSTTVSPPENGTFRDTIQLSAQSESAVATFRGFTDAELAEKLQQRPITGATPMEVMRLMGSITKKPGAIRPYTVTRPTAGEFVLEVT